MGILAGFDRVHLGGHNGQDLEVDAVELVKAAPRAGLHEAREQLPQHLVIDAFRAVEHDALLAQRFAQILHGFGFAGPGGAGGATAQIQMQRARQGQVATVG